MTQTLSSLPLCAKMRYYSSHILTRTFKFCYILLLKCGENRIITLHLLENHFNININIVVNINIYSLEFLEQYVLLCIYYKHMHTNIIKFAILKLYPTQ